MSDGSAGPDRIVRWQSIRGIYLVNDDEVHLDVEEFLLEQGLRPTKTNRRHVRRKLVPALRQVFDGTAGPMRRLVVIHQRED